MEVAVVEDDWSPMKRYRKCGSRKSFKKCLILGKYYAWIEKDIAWMEKYFLGNVANWPSIFDIFR